MRRPHVKILPLNSAIDLKPGDIFNLNIESEVSEGVLKKINRSEKIIEPMVVTHWAMVWIPDVGFAGFFGNDRLEEKLRNLFAGAMFITSNSIPLMV